MSHESPWDSWLCTSELHKNMILLADLLSILSSLMFSLPFIYLCHPLAAPSTAFSSLVSCPPLFLLPLAQSPKHIQPFLTWTLSPTWILLPPFPPALFRTPALLWADPVSALFATLPPVLPFIAVSFLMKASHTLLSSQVEASPSLWGRRGFGFLIALCWE